MSNLIYFKNRSKSFLAAEQADRSWECVNRSHTHECGSKTEAAQFFCWESLFQIFGIVSLQGSAIPKNTCILCIKDLLSFFNFD